MYNRFDVYSLGNEVDRWCVAVVDPDLQMGGGGGGSVSQKTFFGPLGLILVKNKRGVLGPPPVPWIHH